MRLGIGETRLLFRHVLPVAAESADFTLRTLDRFPAHGSLLVEVATGWPGLGPLLLKPTLARDL